MRCQVNRRIAGKIIFACLTYLAVAIVPSYAIADAEDGFCGSSLYPFNAPLLASQLERSIEKYTDTYSRLPSDSARRQVALDSLAVKRMQHALVLGNDSSFGKYKSDLVLARKGESNVFVDSSNGHLSQAMLSIHIAALLSGMEGFPPDVVKVVLSKIDWAIRTNKAFKHVEDSAVYKIGKGLVAIDAGNFDIAAIDTGRVKVDVDDMFIDGFLAYYYGAIENDYAVLIDSVERFSKLIEHNELSTCNTNLEGIALHSMAKALIQASGHRSLSEDQKKSNQHLLDAQQYIEKSRTRFDAVYVPKLWAAANMTSADVYDGLYRAFKDSIPIRRDLYKSLRDQSLELAILY